MGSLSFVEPRFLLLLMLLIPFWVLGLMAWRLPGRRRAPWRTAIGLLLRTLMLLVLVLALSGVQVVRGADKTATAFVLDSSDSVSPAARARGEEYIRRALQAMPEGDQAAVVVFGADGLVERPPSGDKELLRLRLTPDATATDIAGALRLALATLPAGLNRRIVLLSDGAETILTNGSALSVAAEARSSGIPISVVSLAGAPEADDLVVEALQAPATARDGQQVRLMVQARSSAPGPVQARLRLLRDRQQVLDTTVELQPGVNRIPITAEAPRGFRTWEARIETTGDSRGANNVVFGFTEVRGPPRVLLVEGAPGRATNLQAALASARIETETIVPAALPASLAVLDTYETIVLVDVPYRALPQAAIKALPTYVRELGHGLLMVGGEDSYTAGGYRDTPIEQILPVTMQTRDTDVRPDVALVLVIDRSGSMDGQKLELAKEGVAQAYLALDEKDQVGLVAFDSEATWVLPLQPKPPSDAALQAIGGVATGGGTDLRPGLEQATEALEGSDAKIKHVLLLTDGQADHNYDDVLQRMKDAKITLSTVGVGADYDPQLRSIAPETGGRFYEALNFGDIPAIFFDETIRIARRGIVERDFTPMLGSPLGGTSAAVRGLSEAPPLHGYNAVTERDTAQVALVAPGGDPILAQWQYGLGRAAAWTSDLKGQWARDWVTWDGFGRFAAGLIEGLITAPLAEGFEVSATTMGSALSLDLRTDPTLSGAGLSGDAPLRPQGRLLAGDGSVLDVPLVEREPGRFRGTLPLPAAGVYRVQVTDADNHLLATSGAIVPPSAEYLQPEGNPGLLAALATESGGQSEPGVEALWQPPVIPARRSSPLTWPLLWLAALLWPLDIAVRRLMLPRTMLPALVTSYGGRLLRSIPRPGATISPARRRAEVLSRSRRPVAPTNTTTTPAATSGTFESTSTSTAQGQTIAAPDMARSPAAEERVQPDWRRVRRSIPERPADRDRS